MLPTTKDLESVLRVAYADAEPARRAYCENYLFEERVAGPRQTDYESELPDGIQDFDGWDGWHRDSWLWDRMHRPVPQTFTAINTVAAHAKELNEQQYLVRVESLKYALGTTGYSLDEVAGCLRGADPSGKFRDEDSQATLELICTSLNDNPYAVRPRFAGFLEDIEDSLNTDDWPDRLRDRFGLAHHDPRDSEPIPIALM